MPGTATNAFGVQGFPWGMHLDAQWLNCLVWDERAREPRLPLSL